MLRRQITSSLPSLAHRSLLLSEQPHGFPSAASQLIHLRSFSDGPPPISPPSPPSANAPFTYEAPFSVAVRKVKKLSLFSCACAIGAGPIIMGLDAGSTFTAKASIAGTLASFGIFTTGLLHWFTSPYVHRLVYDPKTGSIDVSMLNLLGKMRVDHVNITDVEEADSVHPLSSFAAGGKIYYLDKDHFQNKELLEKLIPSVKEQSQEGENAASDGSSGAQQN